MVQARWNQTQLNRAGHNVIGIAPDGGPGIQMVKDLKPDLVLLDIAMVEMNGDIAAREIVKLDPRPHIVFVSGAAQKFLTDLCDEIGAKLVVKPYSPDYLLAAVDSFDHGNDLPVS